MSEINRESAGVTGLETALGALRPREVTFNRDALMFQAGRATANRTWLWPAITACSVAVAAFMAWSMWLMPAPLPDTRIVYVPVEPSSPPMLASGSNESDRPLNLPAVSYARLCEDVLQHGLDGLPPMPPSTLSAPPTVNDLLHSFES